MKQHCQRCGASSETTRIIEGLCKSCEEKEQTHKSSAADLIAHEIPKLRAILDVLLQSADREQSASLRSLAHQLQGVLLKLSDWHAEDMRAENK